MEVLAEGGEEGFFWRKGGALVLAGLAKGGKGAWIERTGTVFPPGDYLLAETECLVEI